MNEKIKTSFAEESQLAPRKRSFCLRASVVLLVGTAMIALFAPFIASSKPIFVMCGEVFFPSVSHSYGEDSCPREVKPWLINAPLKFGPQDIDLGAVLSPPSRVHPLGTDGEGRDVLAQLVFGARVSVVVGFLAVALATVIGVFLGAVAGYFGKATDALVSRFIEVVYCFPSMFLILTLLALVGPSLANIILVIGLTGWTQTARLVRAEVQRLQAQDFVRSARASGGDSLRIIAFHLIPNAISPVLVTASFGVATAILAESALSFLGFGVAASTASWGSMLSEAWEYVDVAWWLTLAPGSAIFATVAACNAIGERMRDQLSRTQ